MLERTAIKDFEPKSDLKECFTNLDTAFSDAIRSLPRRINAEWEKIIKYEEDRVRQEELISCNKEELNHLCELQVQYEKRLKEASNRIECLENGNSESKKSIWSLRKDIRKFKARDERKSQNVKEKLLLYKQTWLERYESRYSKIPCVQQQEEAQRRLEEMKENLKRLHSELRQCQASLFKAKCERNRRGTEENGFYPLESYILRVAGTWLDVSEMYEKIECNSKRASELISAISYRKKAMSDMHSQAQLKQKNEALASEKSKVAKQEHLSTLPNNVQITSNSHIGIANRMIKQSSFTVNRQNDSLETSQFRERNESSQNLKRESKEIPKKKRLGRFEIYMPTFSSVSSPTPTSSSFKGTEKDDDMVLDSSQKDDDDLFAQNANSMDSGNELQNSGGKLTLSNIETIEPQTKMVQGTFESSNILKQDEEKSSEKAGNQFRLKYFNAFDDISTEENAAEENRCLEETRGKTDTQLSELLTNVNSKTPNHSEWDAVSDHSRIISRNASADQSSVLSRIVEQDGNIANDALIYSYCENKSENGQLKNAAKDSDRDTLPSRELQQNSNRENEVNCNQNGFSAVVIGHGENETDASKASNEECFAPEVLGDIATMDENNYIQESALSINKEYESMSITENEKTEGRNRKYPEGVINEKPINTEKEIIPDEYVQNISQNIAEDHEAGKEIQASLVELDGLEKENLQTYIPTDVEKSLNQEDEKLCANVPNPKEISDLMASEGQLLNEDTAGRHSSNPNTIGSFPSTPPTDNDLEAVQVTSPFDFEKHKETLMDLRKSPGFTYATRFMYPKPDEASKPAEVTGETSAGSLFSAMSFMNNVVSPKGQFTAEQPNQPSSENGRFLVSSFEDYFLDSPPSIANPGTEKSMFSFQQDSPKSDASNRDFLPLFAARDDEDNGKSDFVLNFGQSSSTKSPEEDGKPFKLFF